MQSWDAFKKDYEKDTPFVLWDRYPIDMDTPISVSLKLMEKEPYYFLLESVEKGQSCARYSMIGFDPDLIWTCSDTQAWMLQPGKEKVLQEMPPIDSLRQFISQCRCELPAPLPGIAAGLIGYMNYDSVRFKEQTVPATNPDPIGIPLGMYIRPQVQLVFDSIFNTLYMVFPIYPTPSLSAKAMYTRTLKKRDAILNRLNAAAPQAAYAVTKEPAPLHFEPTTPKASFLKTVQHCKDYIHAGDIFQVLPSQRFSAPFTASGFSLYRSLRHINPSPFLFYLKCDAFECVGSSPEIMVNLKNDTVTIRPLAGTRKRGETPAEDAQLAQSLLADQKERSEHLMLIDLSRHDVGSVSKPGTVTLTEKMVIEYYSHVMHISSTVQGQLKPGLDALDALLAGLPLGTVSGAPKVRAMQIIDELEPVARSFYAGCIGYFSVNGDMDTCVALRTALLKDNVLYVQAGCGVVADSDLESEYEETRHKAKAMMKAAAGAFRFETGPHYDKL